MLWIFIAQLYVVRSTRPVCTMSPEVNSAVGCWVRSVRAFESSEVLRTELVDQSTRAVSLAYDALAIILSYWATELVIVHCWPVLALAPQSRHARRVFDLEYSCHHHNTLSTSQHTHVCCIHSVASADVLRTYGSRMTWGSVVWFSLINLEP